MGVLQIRRPVKPDKKKTEAAMTSVFLTAQRFRPFVSPMLYFLVNVQVSLDLLVVVMTRFRCGKSGRGLLAGSKPSSCT